MAQIRAKTVPRVGPVQAMQDISRPSSGAAVSRDLAPDSVPGERRGTVRAMAAWAGLIGEGGIPAFSDLLGRHRAISKQEFLLKTDPIPHLSVFILCGEMLQSLLGRSPLGATFWERMPRPVRDALSEACAAALKQGTPIQDEGGFEMDSGATLRYRGVFMPLRSDGRVESEYLFGAYGSRIFDAAAPVAA